MLEGMMLATRWVYKASCSSDPNLKPSESNGFLQILSIMVGHGWSWLVIVTLCENSIAWQISGLRSDLLAVLGGML